MRASFAAALIGLFILPSAAPAQDVNGITLEAMPSRTITVVMGTSRAVKTERPYSSVQIVDPTIFDVVPESDRRLNIVPKSPGLTTLVIFDKENKRMSEANIFVQSVPKTALTETDETFRGVPGRVKIHNDPKGLAGVSFYSCTPNCENIKEVSTSFQAPQPKDVSDQREISITSTDRDGNIITTRQGQRISR